MLTKSLISFKNLPKYFKGVAGADLRNGGFVYCKPNGEAGEVHERHRNEITKNIQLKSGWSEFFLRRRKTEEPASLVKAKYAGRHSVKRNISNYQANTK